MMKLREISFLLVTLAVPAWSLDRPPLVNETRPIFQGVEYRREVKSAPDPLAPLVIHSLRIDLSAEEISFLVTPGNHKEEENVRAQPTSGFLKNQGVQMAINGSFFTPFRGDEPYYHLINDFVNVRGLSISNGDTYSVDYPERPVLCVSESSVEIRASGCPPSAIQGIAGNAIILEGGTIVDVPSSVSPSVNTREPRTAVALDAERKTMWLIVVDGRQENYSGGVTYKELAGLAKALGASTVLNMDGGGSTTMVMEGTDGQPQILNAPIDRGELMRERIVANHLGVYALPLGVTPD